ncbi:MFS transporter [Nocardioides nitrophenolicus]|uniref:MFS transporter n=1 Tax=Nocardioides nitrophenolicus TaxID=60489 RepID=UPI00195CC03D|nr:MFS transporter [Nocardioides nitrophenolicus]MBM7517644.1 MFS family permease [Nocardioides nitrophenolicus]
MTCSRSAEHLPTPEPPRGVLLALCGTVTIAYGVLYYAFTVLASTIVDDTGWSATAVTTAFSAGSLVGALAGVGAGQVMQRRGPRLVMTAGSVLAAIAVAVIAVAPSLPVFTIGWLLAGTASAGTFYPPAFAALTQWYGERRVQAITTLTLVAGFSSTIFAPLTAELGDRLGWRATYLVLGALMLVATAPAHALALRPPWRPAVLSGHHSTRSDRSILTSRTFVLVTTSGAVTSLVMYASLVHLVPLLRDRGSSVQLAAWALGLSGAGQVLGRLLYPALQRRTTPNGRATASIVVLALTVLALGLLRGPVPLLIGVAVLAGAARGVFTLVGATVVSDHWGPARYAALNGVYNAPLGIAAALAPAIGAALTAATGGPTGLFVTLGLLGLAAAVLAAFAGGPDSAGLPDERDQPIDPPGEVVVRTVER